MTASVREFDSCGMLACPNLSLSLSHQAIAVPASIWVYRPMNFRNKFGMVRGCSFNPVDLDRVENYMGMADTGFNDERGEIAPGVPGGADQSEAASCLSLCS
jgi:hypothetical protein